jgi:hypothetical protein
MTTGIWTRLGFECREGLLKIRLYQFVPFLSSSFFLVVQLETRETWALKEEIAHKRKRFGVLFSDWY